MIPTSTPTSFVDWIRQVVDDNLESTLGHSSWVTWGKQHLTRHDCQKLRLVFLIGEIHDDLADSVIADLLQMSAEDAAKPINILIDSPGGFASAAHRIRQAISEIPNKLRTICIGQASSAALPILIAGAPGERFAAAKSRLMIHNTQSTTRFTFSVSNHEIESGQQPELVAKLERELRQFIITKSKELNQSEQRSEAESHQQQYIQALTENSNLDDQWLSKAIDQTPELYLQPKEARKHGLIDHLIDGDPMKLIGLNPTNESEATHSRPIVASELRYQTLRRALEASTLLPRQQRLKWRVLILSQGMREDEIETIAADLKEMSGQNKKADISLFIDGSFYSGRAHEKMDRICQTMLKIPNDIRTISFRSFGPAVALLAAGTKGKRFALAGSNIILPADDVQHTHFKIQIDRSGVETQDSRTVDPNLIFRNIRPQFKNFMAEEIKQLKPIVRSIRAWQQKLIDSSDLTADKLQGALSTQEVYLTANQARNCNIVDHIVCGLEDIDTF